MMIMKWKDISIKTMNKYMSLILNWIRLIYLLFAGGSSGDSSSGGGAFAFVVGTLPSYPYWDVGSAICSLLVRALTSLLPGVVL